MTRTNDAGQPIGHPVAGWAPAQPPTAIPVVGRTVRIERLDPGNHGQQLFDALQPAPAEHWTYLPWGPFADRPAFDAWIVGMASATDPFFHALIDTTTDRAVGVAAYLRIDPPQGSIEVGGIVYGPSLQRTVAATEAMYLLMKRAFEELGYRRYEWKCDSLNAPSRAAALRLGFTPEGTFRQHRVYKGRNRDTAWFSITDGEWPAVKANLEAWLDPSNFSPDGTQRSSLERTVPPGTS